VVSRLWTSAAGLYCLVGAFTTVRKQGRELRLLQEKVADVMLVTQLCTVFDILNGEAAVGEFFCKSMSDPLGEDQLSASLIFFARSGASGLKRAKRAKRVTPVFAQRMAQSSPS
jgi:hypothetical protein